VVAGQYGTEGQFTDTGPLRALDRSRKTGYGRDVEGGVSPLTWRRSGRSQRWTRCSRTYGKYTSRCSRDKGELRPCGFSNCKCLCRALPALPPDEQRELEALIHLTGSLPLPQDLCRFQWDDGLRVVGDETRRVI
jgi:hypothetical protein